jgi:hypothetical protein
LVAQGEEVSLSAAATESADAAADEAGPKIGDLVAAARMKALEVRQGGGSRGGRLGVSVQPTNTCAAVASV